MDEQYIQGVSDYCDHWCERCALKARCKDFVKGVDPFIENFMENPGLLERVRKNFEKAMSKIELEMNDGSRDVRSIIELEKQKKRLLYDNPLVELSRQYFEISSAWLKTQPGMLDRLEKLKEELSTGVESSEGGRSKADMIRNSLAIIKWDSTLIHSKIVHGLSSRIKEQSDFLLHDDANSNGVIKVTLLSIERSLEAWRLMFDLLNDREDDFLETLALLQKLHRMILVEFPDAVNFKRPGFDD